MIISFTIITLTLIALCCYLAVKFHNVDKTIDRLSEKAQALQPVTMENLSAVLRAKGCTIGDVDENGNIIGFTYNDLRYHADISRKPVVFLRTGFRLDEDDDRECAMKAMMETIDSIIMVKGDIHEEGYSFIIASQELLIGNFAESFERYMDIFNDAIRYFGERYHEAIGEKNGREQALEEMQGRLESAGGKAKENKILS